MLPVNGLYNPNISMGYRNTVNPVLLEHQFCKGEGGLLTQVASSDQVRIIRNNHTCVFIDEVDRLAST